MNKTKIILLIAGTLIGSALLAQTTVINKQQLVRKVDSAVQKLMEKIPVVPAIAISIVDDNGPLLSKGYGWANKETGVKADENTLFYIASNTKAFMGLVAAMLDSEKKILLDSSFKKYFSPLHFKNDISNKISYRHLLTHTSGLQNNAIVFRMAFSGDIEKETMLRLFTDATIARTEYGIFNYDNLGYNIYGLALQEHLHKKWQDVLKERIFAPLGMSRTTSYISLAEKNKWPIAAPYSAYGEKGLTKLNFNKADNTMQSAGGIVTTASDISKWLQIQITQGKLNNKQVFPTELIKATQAGFASYDKGPGPTPTGKYALGWYISKWDQEDFIFHEGGYPGYKSHLSFMPGKKAGLAILVNEGSIGENVVNILSIYIYDLVRGVADADQSFAKRIEELEGRHLKTSESFQRSLAERANRTSQLTLPLNAYTGTYRHERFGDIVVKEENNVLAVQFGNMYAVSTPFTEKETIRIELYPGSGKIIFFKSGDDGKMNGLTYDGSEYKKVK